LSRGAHDRKKKEVFRAGFFSRPLSAKLQTIFADTEVFKVVHTACQQLFARNLRAGRHDGAEEEELSHGSSPFDPLVPHSTQSKTSPAFTYWCSLI
jgi:hypothetical protein